MTKRRFGTIDTERNGKKRARVRVDGKLESIGTFDTDADAELALAQFAEGMKERRPVAGQTLASWGAMWLNTRELDGVHRDVKNDRHAWKRLEGAPFARLPLRSITVRDLRNWIAEQLRTINPKTGKRPARQTVVNAVNLFRVALEDACNAGHLDANPARGVLVPKVARTHDGWTWLKQTEVDALLSVDEAELRDIFEVAIYSGLRSGEIFGLEWVDVDLHASTAVIRHSWKGRPTKKAHIRTLHLFANVADALKRQKARSGNRPNVFPARDGEARSKDQTPSVVDALASVGIKRRVRFHDLRHTCASHLISGTWGRAWTLEEVAKHLGHSTSATTRRYAHLCPEGLAKAARETRPRSPDQVPESRKPGNDKVAQLRGISGGEGIRTPGTVACSPVFKTVRESNDFKVVSSVRGTFAGRAQALLEGLRAGTTTAEDVAALAAEWLSQPDPTRRAAERFGALVGTEHEGMAAVQFLELVAELPVSVGTPRTQG